MRLLGHQFRDRELLHRALTHRSVIHENGISYFQVNEMLEFLGDSVLGFVVVDYLYNSFPNKREGDLSKIKSAVVSGKSLQKIALKLKLGQHILMSRNEVRSGGRNRSSILEDTLEAIIAALYIDGGLDAARRFINEWIIDNMDELTGSKQDFNYKSQLLEHIQGIGLSSPVYRVISEVGPDHRKRFEIEVLLDDEVLGIGTGKSKKDAQQQAARAAVERLAIAGE